MDADPSESRKQELQQAAMIQAALTSSESLSARARTALKVAELESSQMHEFEVQTSEQRAVLVNNFVWGRLLWEVMHLLAESYPENPTPDTQRAAVSFLRSLVHLIPCQETCAPEWAAALEREPPEAHVGSRLELSEYMRLRHNEVNARLGGKQFSRNDLLLKLAEQKNALAAVVYYAGKEDYDALAAPKVSLRDRLAHECRKLGADPQFWTAVIVGVVLGLLLLGLWAINKAVSRGSC